MNIERILEKRNFKITKDDELINRLIDSEHYLLLREKSRINEERLYRFATMIVTSSLKRFSDCYVDCLDAANSHEDLLWDFSYDTFEFTTYFGEKYTFGFHKEKCKECAGFDYEPSRSSSTNTKICECLC